MGYDNFFNANRRTLNHQRVNSAPPFCSIEIDCESRISVSRANLLLHFL